MADDGSTNTLGNESAAESGLNLPEVPKAVTRSDIALGQDNDMSGYKNVFGVAILAGFVLHAVLDR